VQCPRARKCSLGIPTRKEGGALSGEKVTEYKKHYSVTISEEELCRYPDQIHDIISLFSTLQEGEWFNIPDYGTDAWADWMIDLHLSRKRRK